MKIGRIPKHLLTFLLVVTVHLFATEQLSAMCPVITLSVNKVQGQINVPDGRKGFPDTPFAHTKVVLSKLGEAGDVLVTTAETDENGFFEMEGISKGEYRLVVHFLVNGTDIMRPFEVILKVKKSKTVKSSKYIYVSLSPASCFETIAKTITRKA